MKMKTGSTSRKILHNSLWYGLETILDMLVFMAASIAVARYLGPEKLGYFSAINFPVMLICGASGTGLALATRKYMTDFLGVGQVGAARAVYEFNYKYQLLGALVITAIGLAIVWPLVGHANRLMAVLMVLSIIPGMMSWVPAQANLAFEDASKNTISALGYVFSYGILIVLTIRFKWDLPGVAASFLIARTIETVMRTVPLNRFLKTLPLEPLPDELAGRIRRFCLQAIAIQVLISVVWSRSEIFFLTAFSDIKQVAFYSVSAGLADRLLIFPKVFGSATGASLMAESARDRFRVGSIVNNAFRYLGLIALPVHVGAALLARQAVWVVYGEKYMPAVPVMIIAAITAIPRAFQDMPDTLMRSADRQWDLLRCLIYTGILNMALDFALIPRYGAIGAAIGNGVGQTFGVVLLWYTARKIYEFTLPWRSMVRIGLATAVMAAVTFAVARSLSPAWALAAGVAAGAPTYMWMVRLLHALEPLDYLRLKMVGDRLPSPLRRGFDGALQFLVPGYRHAEAAAAAVGSSTKVV
ncbi:MAG: polysaccharide biosynthesis C-terminal domain-containing protein [Acidobacteriaceae bacterium]